MKEENFRQISWILRAIHILWCGDLSFDPDFVPSLEDDRIRHLDESEKLAMGKPDPVGAPLLLPGGLNVQVMEAIAVHLQHLPDVAQSDLLIRFTATDHRACCDVLTHVLGILIAIREILSGFVSLSS